MASATTNSPICSGGALFGMKELVPQRFIRVTKRTADGVTLSAETQQALGKISEQVKSTEAQMSELHVAFEDLAKAQAVLTEAADSIVDITESNSAGAEQMAAQSTQVADAVSSIASIIEETAASAEEVSASAEEQHAAIEEVATSAKRLARLAEDLNSMVGGFKA